MKTEAAPVLSLHTSVLSSQVHAGAGRHPQPEGGWTPQVRLHLQLSLTPPFLLGGLGRWTPVPLCALLPHQGTLSTSRQNFV